MRVHALTVIAAITGLTLALIAGHQRWQHRLEHLAPHLPNLAAAILILMGAGFMVGLL